MIWPRGGRGEPQQNENSALDTFDHNTHTLWSSIYTLLHLEPDLWQENSNLVKYSDNIAYQIFYHISKNAVVT